MEFSKKIEKHAKLITKFDGNSIWRKNEALYQLKIAFTRMQSAFREIDYSVERDRIAELEMKYLALGLLYDRTPRRIRGLLGIRTRTLG